MAKRYYTDAEVRKALRRACEQRGVQTLAEAAIVPIEHIGDILSNKSPLTHEITREIGFRPVTRFVRIAQRRRPAC
jgi:hypothetical protein